MSTVRIMNEFLHGPVWVLDEEGIPAAEGSLLLVEDDVEVRDFNQEAGSLFDSYYEFEPHGMAALGSPLSFRVRRYASVANALKTAGRVIFMLVKGGSIGVAWYKHVAND